jgi:hypothetical protein
MNRNRISDLTRSLIGKLSRRNLVASLIGGVFGTTTTLFPQVLNAKKKRRRKKRKNRKQNPQEVIFNDFGCVDVGGSCANSGYCCSGICQGQKGQQTCRAHDSSTCQGEDSCFDTTFPCATTTGEEGGFCMVTTGAAAYCGAATAIRCFDCSKDADCVPYCGPQAACIACADCVAINGEETACAGPSATSCNIPK